MSAPWVIGSLAGILVFAFVAALTARWALANRNDPADVEVTAPVRSNVTPPDGVVQDANGRFRVIREVKR